MIRAGTARTVYAFSRTVQSWATFYATNVAYQYHRAPQRIRLQRRLYGLYIHLDTDKYKS